MIRSLPMLRAPRLLALRAVPAAACALSVAAERATPKPAVNSAYVSDAIPPPDFAPTPNGPTLPAASRAHWDADWSEAQVATGALAAQQVHFYSGYAAWPIERLEEEVAAGKWTVVKASAQMLREGIAEDNIEAKLRAAVEL